MGTLFLLVKNKWIFLWVLSRWRHNEQPLSKIAGSKNSISNFEKKISNFEKIRTSKLWKCSLKKSRFF